MSNYEVLITYIASICVFFIGIVLVLLLFIRAQKRRSEYRIGLIKTEFEAQEQTKRKLAHDLHDNIGQLLSITNLTLGSVEFGDLEKAKQKIEDTHLLISRAMNELRQLSRLTHAEHLLSQGLKQSLETELNWLEKSGLYKVTFSFAVNNDVIPGVENELAIFRVVQEALNNIVRHAKATEVRLDVSQAGKNIRIEVGDDGKGFDPDLLNKKTGLGLTGMRRRLEILGGSMQIRSAPGEGTQILFTIPITSNGNPKD